MSFDEEYSKGPVVLDFQAADYWVPVDPESCWAAYMPPGTLLTSNRIKAVLAALRSFCVVGRVRLFRRQLARVHEDLAELGEPALIDERQEVFASPEERLFRKTEHLLEGKDIWAPALSGSFPEMAFPKTKPDDTEVKMFAFLNGRPPTPAELRKMAWRVK